jgi:nucleoside-diphosphate-sugar epimerase
VITGASGFLGGFVARAFGAQPGTEVIRVSRREAPGTTRVTDYSDSPAGDVLIHLAQEADQAKVVAEGTAHEERALASLRALLAKGYSRVVYASSGALYGDADERPHTPRDPVQTGDAYARLKRESEVAVIDSGGTAARLANLYGPGIRPETVLGTILAQIPGNGPLRVRTMRPIRDFLWAEDAAEGFVALASAPAGSGGRVVNLGTGIGTSIGDVARTALRVAGQEQREVLETTEHATASTLILDYAETTSLCGWTPRIALRDGLARLLEHVRRN